MAKRCPLSDDYVLYLECKECPLEYECRMGLLSKEKEPKKNDQQ